MPFNTADTLKQALAIPVQQGITAAASTVGGLISSTTKTASQNTSDFGVASASQKSAEAIGKVVDQGTAGQFDSVNRQIKMVYENQFYTVKEADTNKTLGKVGDPTPPSVPAEFLEGPPTPEMSELKVTITQEPRGIRTSVVFDVMPTIDESRSVQYEPFTPLHHPGEILKYKNTASRTWSISAKLVSRNLEEADRNYAIIQAIRSWAMPYYGAGTQKSHPDILGAPPPILTLQAYGKNMIGPVKCVMESYNWQWPNDVDFLPAFDPATEQSRPFPVIVNVSITLKETWSPAEFSGFSITDYQRGDMQAAFSKIARTPRPQTFVPVGSVQNRDAIRRSEAQIMNQGQVNNSSSNIASNVPPSNGSISPPSLATPGFNPSSGQIGGAVPGTDIYGN